MSDRVNKVDAVIRKTVLFLFRMIHKDPEERTVDGFVQFIKFGIVGASNTIVSYGLNILVLKILQPYNLLWDYVAGNGVAFLLSVLWSFFWNNKYVFIQKEGERRFVWKALLKTYAAYGFTGIILTNIFSYIWINVLHISKYVAPLMNLVISIPLNFVINKLWAFKSETTEPSNADSTMPLKSAMVREEIDISSEN